MAPLDPALATAPFATLLTAAEAIGANRGLPEVIQLYTAWIAAQPAGTPDVHCAWFNLGAELAQAGAEPEAIEIYRQALILSPALLRPRSTLACCWSARAKSRLRCRRGKTRSSLTTPELGC